MFEQFKKHFFSLSSYIKPQQFQYILIVLVMVVFVSQMMYLEGMLETLARDQATFRDEVGGKIQTVEELSFSKQDLLEKYSEDLNEMRSYLLLPPKDYGFQKNDVLNPVKEKDLAYSTLRYFDYLGDDQALKENKNRIQSIFEKIADDENFKKLIDNFGVQQRIVEENGLTFLVLNEKNIALLGFTIDLNEQIVEITKPHAEQKFPFETDSDVQQIIIETVRSDTQFAQQYISSREQKKNELKELLKSQRIQKVLTEKRLEVNETFQVDNNGFFIAFQNSYGEDVGGITIDKVHLDYDIPSFQADITLDQVEIPTEEKILMYLQNIDLVSERSSDILSKRDEFISLLNEEAFKITLEKRNLHVILPPTETESGFVFDVTSSSSGDVLQKIVLEKDTGQFVVVNSSGAKLFHLLNFQTEEQKKKVEIPDILPEFSDIPVKVENGFTVLIAGKHQNLVDSIVLAHLSHETKEVYMVSIPRDLYFNGRKINSVYSLYGMEEFVRQVENLSGIQIDRHVLIDMYAFIEVVDYLGGVNVTLDHTVIDPSYRVVDNGKEGTLYYDIGTHHLSGVQALRLARSRHYSSDFARAERQQLILKGVKEKVFELGVLDADTLFDIAFTALGKTETDIGVQDALTLYFRYKSYEFGGGEVLSTGNVLESQYEGEFLGKCTRSNCDIEDRGAYILLPENNDWKLIQWFFQKSFDIL